MTWSEGDQVVVVYGDVVEVFDISEGAGTSTAKFAKADSQLAEQSGEVTVYYFPGYAESKTEIDFSKQAGTLDDLGKYDTFSFSATLTNGKIKEGKFSPAMAIFRFPAGLDFGAEAAASDFVFSGGVNKQVFGSTPTTGDITVEKVSLAEGKLSQDLYVSVWAGDATSASLTPTILKVGAKTYVLPKGFEAGKVYTFEQKHLKEAVPLTIEAVANGEIIIKNDGFVISYRKNSEEMMTSTEGDTNDITIEVAAGDKVQFFGDNDAYGGDLNINCTASSKVYGNIMSLISSTDYMNQTTLESEYTFSDLFQDNEGLTDASGLILPAATLTPGCYYSMFSGCISLTAAPALPATTLAESCYAGMFEATPLTTAPELPATTLAESCYGWMFEACEFLTTAPALLPATTLERECYFAMFNGCISLTAAPELPATTLAEGCYDSMFSSCESLTAAPELPATTLAESCYDGMFSGCISLTAAPELPVTTLAKNCYRNMFRSTSLTSAPALPATTLAEGCYYGMFSNTSLTAAPELPATTLAKNCYRDMFSSTNLTTAPELPVTTLAEGCYADMFSHCKSLTSAPELPATTLERECYGHMFYGCESLTEAPVLPAESLVYRCYSYMFYECTNLKSVTCLATDIPDNTWATESWLYKVSATGTFTKAAGMTSWATGAYGIPEGWTIVEK